MQIKPWLLTAFKASALLASLGLMAWLSQLNSAANRCLNSAVVEDVRVIGGETQGANSLCGFSGLGSLLAGHEDPVWAHRQLINTIEDVNSLSSLLPAPQRRISIEVLPDAPFAYQVGDRVLNLGGAFLRNPLLLQRALVASWLHQTMPGLRDDQLELEILTDFMLAVHRRKAIFADLLAPIDESDRQLSWFTELSSFREYCFGSSRAPAHLAYCLQQNGQQQNATVVKTLDQVTVWSLRRLASTLLWRLYDGLSLKAKNQFLQQMLTQAARGQLHLMRELPTNETSETLAVWLSSSALRWPSLFLKQTDRPLANMALLASLRQLLVPGHGEPEMRLILPERTADTDWLERKIALSQRVEPLLVSTPADNYVLTDSGKKRIYARSGVHRQVLLSCKPIRVKQLGPLPRESTLVVNTCRSDSLAALEPLLQGDFEEFIVANRVIPFIWLSSIGLRTVEGRHLRKNSWSGERLTISLFRKASHWQDDEWDRKSFAFRPRAAIEVVRLHRASAALF